MVKILERIWKVLISLKLAVVNIASLAICLMVATIIESKIDSKTAQYWVYQARWFYAILTLLGLNILAVAISRYPWKRKHTPFLMAHAGILMILIGAWLTYSKGLDGSLRISENEVNSAVELDRHVLVYTRKDDNKSIPFDWMPESVAQNFKPYDIKEFGIRVEKFVSDAEPKINFLPTATPADPAHAKSSAAILIRILGSPMGGAPEFWLWSGDAGWSTQKLGPARFLIRSDHQKDLVKEAGISSDSPEARLDFVVNKAGELHFEATSIRGEIKTGKITLSDKASEPTIVNPEWKMPIKIQVKKFIPNAVNSTEYETVKVKAAMGNGLPNPAMQVSLLSNPSSKLWLGLGDRAEFTEADGTTVSIGYMPKRVILPYAVRLKQFELKHNPGTMDPAAYSSFVQIVDQLQKNETEMNTLPVHHITMNEPLAERGYTFYQASYIPDFPRPTTTILSVNYDPGRALKYWGSLLLVSGAILLYLIKAVQKKKPTVENL